MDLEYQIKILKTKQKILMMVSEQTKLSENHKHEQKTSLAAAYTIL